MKTTPLSPPGPPRRTFAPCPGAARCLLVLLALHCLPRAGAADAIWFDDALPAGAGGSGTWNWVGSNPAPFSGTLAHQTALSGGLHEQWFNWAGATLTVDPGDTLFTHVFIDRANPPRELMLNWKADNWEHRAYWGENLIAYGTDGTAGRRYMGPLPDAGRWVRLDVPASSVALEGATLRGMSFSLYDGRATWDLTGKAAAGPGGAPGTSTDRADYLDLRLPRPGDHTLHVLSPDLLELVLINTKQRDPARVDTWDWVDDNGNFTGPDLARLQVRVGGQPVAITGAGFKRRPLHAPLHGGTLLISNHLFLRLNQTVANGQAVEVRNDGSQWPAGMIFAATADPLRYSPAIHVNQEGYLTAHPKKAMVGYHLGNLGEMNVPATSFALVAADTGAVVHQGALTPRPDTGYVYTPTPYQKVFEADFSGFNPPGGAGNYRLTVPGLGASLPFPVHDGVAMNFARTYALGLLHQRSGFDVAMPFTRFTHAADHTAPAFVPTHAGAPFEFTWRTIARYASEVNSDNPPQTAPRLTSPSAQLYPFVNPGPVNASGGHFEAGNYSRVTWNCAQLLHLLVFAADALLPPGGTALDNLGLPESGDGISDLLQEAKWEADWLARMQDADGGFYYTTYPINREYENDVLPENGDQEVVWPKNTAATAAAVAALAQIASSPRFQQAYPADAARYGQKAVLGWQFLTRALATHGRDGAYQRIMHFGDLFADRDELAWAACELFLATGEPQYRQKLLEWFPDPADPATFRWGWWRQYACYGNATRSYAFAERSGRVPPGGLDAGYLARCVTVITDCGNDNLRWSRDSAYGSSFPDNTKRVRGAGWYFSTVQAFDIVVAHQLAPHAAYLDAILANLNYEGGCNPVNATYLTGIGRKRQREAVDQYSANDRRILPKTGLPLGNIQEGFTWTSTYGGELGRLTYPSDGTATAPYPFYDRWSDFWNVTTEHSSIDLARSLAGLAWLAAQTPTAGQAWRSAAATISVPGGARVGQPVTVTLQVSGMDPGGARIVWEARDQEPAFGVGSGYTFTPTQGGSHWIEAEAHWPDGRRAFAIGSVSVEQ